MDSILLIGQSNMAGRGFLKEAVEVDTSRIYTLRNGRWLQMFRPINPDRSFSGASLAESFAESYANKHDTQIGLVCCADGGTNIDQWEPGSVLYDNAVFQAKLAQRSSNLVGILWHQGESDCAAPRHLVYKEKLYNLLNSLRKDLGNENIPIVIGGLGDYLPECPRPDWNFENYPVINDALRAAAKELTNVAFASAEGLTPNPDKLHFNAASLHEFGKRYFAAFETLVSSRTAGPDGDLQRSQMELL